MSDAILQKLSDPFDPSEVKFKPSVVRDNRALALAYVDARVIQDRLDDVLGVVGWQDEYDVLADGSVVCKLRCRIGDDWITKVDVGSQSEQPDGGDRMKAAFSDALKRAAVKFGIGRYLYRMPQQWCDYDPRKKQFTRTPAIPQEFLPAKQDDAVPRANGTSKPETMSGLIARMDKREAKLVLGGLCAPGDLIAFALGDLAKTDDRAESIRAATMRGKQFVQAMTADTVEAVLAAVPEPVRRHVSSMSAVLGWPKEPHRWTDEQKRNAIAETRMKLLEYSRKTVPA